MINVIKTKANGNIKMEKFYWQTSRETLMIVMFMFNDISCEKIQGFIENLKKFQGHKIFDFCLIPVENYWNFFQFFDSILKSDHIKQYHVLRVYVVMSHPSFPLFKVMK